MNQVFLKMVMLIFLMSLLSGCSEKRKVESNPNMDPEPIDISASIPLDFEMETDYSNIILEMEHTFSLEEVEIIECSIINLNVGKGFWYFHIPYIENYADGKWIRLSYYPNEYYNEEGRWYICGVEGNRTESNSCEVFLETQYISEEVKEGKYRIVVFVGNEKRYAEFEITK